MIPLFIAKLNLFFLAAVNDKCTPRGGSFFFLPHWWQYVGGKVDSTGTCAVNFNFPDDIWLVGLSIIDMLLVIAGFVAVASIIIAGGQLILSEGSPEKATNARNRLINSLVGLAIAAGAAALVGFIGAYIGGGGTNALPHTGAGQGSINRILNTVLAVLGALAFLYLVLAGFRFITSGDNTNKVAEARRQIIYALAGLVVIAMSATIVNFVLGKLN
jgi:hypothetical protein